MTVAPVLGFDAEGVGSGHAKRQTLTKTSNRSPGYWVDQRYADPFDQITEADIVSSI